MSRLPSCSTPILALAGLAIVLAVAPSRVMAQAEVPPQMRNEAIALMKICRADYDRLCSGVRPGGGRILACLRSHASQLSPSCGQAMSRAQTLKDNAAAAGVLPN